MYGTGKPAYDRCESLHYDDFTKYRTEKIAAHHWYKFDTVYHFTEGATWWSIICAYARKELYLGYTDLYSKPKRYHYIELSDGDAFIYTVTLPSCSIKEPGK